MIAPLRCGWMWKYADSYEINLKGDVSIPQISTFCETWRGGRSSCSRRRDVSRENGSSATTTASSSSWATSPTASSCPTTCTGTCRERSRSGNASSRRGCSCTLSSITSELCLLIQRLCVCVCVCEVTFRLMFELITQVYASRWPSGPLRAHPGELPAKVSKDCEETAVSLRWENMFNTLLLAHGVVVCEGNAVWLLAIVCYTYANTLK